MEGSAFYQSGLTSVTLPEGIVSLGSGAFEDCADLKTGYIPSAVAVIGADCFPNSPAVFTVSPDNPVFKSADGQLVLKEEAEP